LTYSLEASGITQQKTQVICYFLAFLKLSVINRKNSKPLKIIIPANLRGLDPAFAPSAATIDFPVRILMFSRTID